MGVQELEPHELADRLRRGDRLDVIDVREPYEWRIARIDGARLIPLSTFGAMAAALPHDRDLVLYCHHGTRSRAAAEFLVQQGFSRVWNLTGGIARWSAEVDPAVPTY
jgi:adenylyltransferase/sulfurtransferase